MKHIEVAAAVIYDNCRILATQRGYGDFKDMWEFPGGKIEPGETPEEALKREIHEELNTEIAIEELIHTTEYDYPDFHLTLHCYRCHVVGGDIKLLEHEAARWLLPSELDAVKWLPADREVIERLSSNAE